LQSPGHVAWLYLEAIRLGSRKHATKRRTQTQTAAKSARACRSALQLGRSLRPAH